MNSLEGYYGVVGLDSFWPWSGLGRNTGILRFAQDDRGMGVGVGGELVSGELGWVGLVGGRSP